MTHDPVCGCELSNEDLTNCECCDFMGNTFFFCSSSCREAFETDPDRYTAPGLWDESENQRADDYDWS